MSDILFHEKKGIHGYIGEIILNRPHTLNALSMDMCQRFSDKLMEWKTKDDVLAVIVKSTGDRAFCAGGDIRALYDNQKTNPHLMTDFFWYEYQLNTIIHHFSKPYFAFLDGITMGGGAGISIHGHYRIATENLTFAMPETKIGFFPDVGASYFLNQCPGYSGLYLGLTGTAIPAATAYKLNLVTHIISKQAMTTLETALLKSDRGIESLIESLTQPIKHDELFFDRETIDACFSGNTIDEIIYRLSEKNDWARNVAKQLKKRSPTSLEIAFQTYHRGKHLSFDEIMQMEFDVTQQFLQSPDFFEGIRAAIIDKDQTPKWQEKASAEAITAYFNFKGKSLLIT